MKIKQGKNTITTEISYIAGFFDGEGCVRIKKAGHSNNCFFVIAHLTNTNLEILQKVKLLFGGSIRFQEEGRNKRIYNWSLSCSEAVDFLRTLLPFLIEKREQAELALHFHFNKEILSKDDKIILYQKMRDLKKQQISYENPELLTK